MNPIKLFQHNETRQVIELPEVGENIFEYFGERMSRLNLLGAGWWECERDPGYRGLPPSRTVSRQFSAALELAKFLETQNRPKDWNFADAVTLEIHYELVELIEQSQPELLTNFAVVGGEILDYDPNDQLVPIPFFSQVLGMEQP